MLKANYSNSRLALLEFRRCIEAYQHAVMVWQICRRVWARWMDVAVMAGALDLPGYEGRRREYVACAWLPPRWDWVDPLKDARAEIEQIEAGLKSRTQALAERGYDAEQVDAEIAAIMGRQRDVAKIIEDVVSMRALMARERKPRHAFDLKLANGGLVDLEFIAQSAQLIAGSRIGLPQASTARVLARLAEIGLVPKGQRLAEIHTLYATILQVMSSALISPFKEEAWSPAFRELLAQLAHYPDFGRLELDIQQMQAEVAAAAETWYEKAASL